MTKLVNGTCNLKLIIAPPPSRHFCLPTVLALISLFHLLDRYRSIDECGRQCLLAVGGVKDLSDVTEQVRRGTGICKQPLPFISICLVQPFHVLCHDRQLQSFPLCVMQHQIQNTRDPPLSFTFHSAMILWCQSGCGNDTEYSLLIADVLRWFCTSILLEYFMCLALVWIMANFMAINYITNSELLPDLI